MHSEPATVGVIIPGGTWRNPGPSLSVEEGFDGVGSTSEEISSPGKTNVSVAIIDAADNDAKVLKS